MSDVQWHDLPHERIDVCGLPWFDENAPEMWRLPGRVMDRVPQGVRRQAMYPGGGRIRLMSDTSQLHLRVSASPATAGTGLGVYVEGTFWRTMSTAAPEGTQVECFADLDREVRDVTIYLPYRQQIRIAAVGVDRDAELRQPPRFARDLPLVLYGSSVAQGASASRPGMSYAAILARSLNLDFVNLGFGGAGKAEPEVVELVSSVEACCYLFDLGKSYGRQPVGPYAAMLEQVRSDHPDAPMVCITPIFSTRELYRPEYVELSEHTRSVVRQVARKRIEGGDSRAILVEGLDLLGPGEEDGFSSDGVHPGDLGFCRIAERLKERLDGALGPN